MNFLPLSACPVAQVQYPQVERLFRGDMATMRSFCRIVAPEQVAALDEVERSFLTEFDYVREARSASCGGTISDWRRMFCAIGFLPEAQRPRRAGGGAGGGVRERSAQPLPRAHRGAAPAARAVQQERAGHGVPARCGSGKHPCGARAPLRWRRGVASRSLCAAFCCVLVAGKKLADGLREQFAALLEKEKVCDTGKGDGSAQASRPNFGSGANLKMATDGLKARQQHS